MAKAAFLTYNTVGDNGDWPNGEHMRNGHTAVIVAHPRGERWGAQVDGRKPTQSEAVKLGEADSGADERFAQAVGETREQVMTEIYSGALDPEKLAGLDYLVVYVGAGGSEGAIELAARAGREKVRFVLCDCGLDTKLGLISEALGGEIFPYLVCECGGRTAMERLVNEFLETGVVGPRL